MISTILKRWPVWAWPGTVHRSAATAAAATTNDRTEIIHRLRIANAQDDSRSSGLDGTKLWLRLPVVGQRAACPGNRFPSLTRRVLHRSRRLAPPAPRRLR